LAKAYAIGHRDNTMMNQVAEFLVYHDIPTVDKAIERFRLERTPQFSYPIAPYVHLTFELEREAEGIWFFNCISKNRSGTRGGIKLVPVPGGIEFLAYDFAGDFFSQNALKSYTDQLQAWLGIHGLLRPPHSRLVTDKPLSPATSSASPQALVQGDGNVIVQQTGTGNQVSITSGSGNVSINGDVIRRDKL